MTKVVKRLDTAITGLDLTLHRIRQRPWRNYFFDSKDRSAPEMPDSKVGTVHELSSKASRNLERASSTAKQVILSDAYMEEARASPPLCADMRYEAYFNLALPHGLRIRPLQIQ